MSSLSTQALGPIPGPSCWTPPPPLRILSPSPKAIVRPSPLPPAREIAPLVNPQVGAPFTIGDCYVLSREVYYAVYNKFIFAQKVIGINEQLGKELEMYKRGSSGFVGLNYVLSAKGAAYESLGWSASEAKTRRPR